jgi:hypothetical protein
MKIRQIDIVRNILENEGCITRNRCLGMYITRLSAIIYKLKQEGWEFKGKNIKTKWGTDYAYQVISQPPHSNRSIPKMSKSMQGNLL